MIYSVTVTNKSGADQGVALYVSDNSHLDSFSLVWQKQYINNNGRFTFTWLSDSYGLGWGTISGPLGPGTLFSSGEAPTPVYPDKIGGHNVLSVHCSNTNFYSGNTSHSDSGLLEIKTDQSFNVATGLKMSVAMYISALPALAMRGAPNNACFFDTKKLSYWLTVTNLKQSTVLPVVPEYSNSMSISMTTPKKINFGASVKPLNYTLDDLLLFNMSDQ